MNDCSWESIVCDIWIYGSGDLDTWPGELVAVADDEKESYLYRVKLRLVPGASHFRPNLEV